MPVTRTTPGFPSNPERTSNFRVQYRREMANGAGRPGPGPYPIPFHRGMACQKPQTNSDIDCLFKFCEGATVSMDEHAYYEWSHTWSD